MANWGNLFTRAKVEKRKPTMLVSDRPQTIMGGLKVTNQPSVIGPTKMPKVMPNPQAIPHNGGATQHLRSIRQPLKEREAPVPQMIATNGMNYRNIVNMISKGPFIDRGPIRPHSRKTNKLRVR